MLDYYRRDYQTALDARLKLALEGREAEDNQRQIAFLYHAMDQSQLRRAYGDSLRFVADTALATLMDAGAHVTQLAWRHSELGLAYALMGEEEAAIREGKQAVEMNPVSVDANNGVYLVWNLARIYLLIGHHDAAIEQLEFLLSVPSRMTAAKLRLSPFWDPLRDHPRFQALLEREQ